MRLISSRNTFRPLEFARLPTDCWVCVSHKPNVDGYFRYRLHGRKTGQFWMFHRLMWVLKKGPIPAGYEINHLCNNRGCCNIDHLECIPGDVHASQSNEDRWRLPSGLVSKGGV